MLRLVAVLALAVPIVAVPWSSADAAGKRPRTACERLAGRDLAPAPKLKVVLRVREGTLTIRACTLRGGKVRTLLSYTAQSPFESSEIEVEATTDRYVLISESYAEKGTGRGLTRVDARTRRETSIAAQTCDPLQYCSGTSALAAQMHRSGAVAAITRELPPCCTAPAESMPLQVVVFGVDGTRRVLDEGPELTGLALEGDEVVWSRSGQPQRAPIG